MHFLLQEARTTVIGCSSALDLENPFQVVHFLLKLLYLGLVFVCFDGNLSYHLPRSLNEFESIQRFFYAAFLAVDIRDHYRKGVSAEGVLEQSGEFRLAVGGY